MIKKQNHYIVTLLQIFFIRTLRTCVMYVMSATPMLIVFNDRFYLSFFVATHGFRESGFDFY